MKLLIILINVLLIFSCTGPNEEENNNLVKMAILPSRDWCANLAPNSDDSIMAFEKSGDAYLDFYILTYNMTDGDIVKISQYQGINPFWSKEDEYVSYFSFRENVGIQIIDLEHNMEISIPESGINTEGASWSPAKNEILFVSDISHNPVIYNIENNDYDTLDISDTNVIWSFDGNSVYSFKFDEQINETVISKYSRISSELLETLYLDSNYYGYRYTFSPDGKYLSFDSNGGYLCILNMETKKVIQISQDDFIFADCHMWSETYLYTMYFIGERNDENGEREKAIYSWDISTYLK